MQVALGAVMLIAVLWFVALRPKPTSTGGSPASSAAPAQAAPTAPGAAGLERAVDKAHGAADTASADAQRAASSDAESGSKAAATPSGDSHTAKTSHSSAATATKTTAHPAARGHVAAHKRPADPNVRRVRTALRQHKAIAIAFVSPQAADSRAVSQEIRHVSGFHGRAFSLSVPLSQLSRYGFITRGVDVAVAPTIVIVAPNHDATTISGFADRYEIQQRLADVLAAKHSHS